MPMLPVLSLMVKAPIDLMADAAVPPAVRVGLLGLGVVGAGVHRALHERADVYTQRSGRRIVVERIAVRDRKRARTVDVGPVRLEDDPLAVATASDVDVVVEVMGGEELAMACIHAALDAGKSVITANKEVMAKHGPGLLELAQARRVELLYEASVGGGIPIIAPLKRDLQANEVRRIQAIINGTTNFILTAMANDGMSYELALTEAQRRGYAEADPTSDVEGIDAAYKLAILSSLAFHATVRPADVYREGITRIAARDFRYAGDLGYVIRLIATAVRIDGALDVRVHPMLVPERDPLARVDGVLNAVAVEGDLLGRAVFEGEGAGASATTSAVVADLLDVVYGMAAGQEPRPLRPIDSHPCILPIGDLRMRYYFRILVRDQPGVLAAVGGVLAENRISIASLLQVEADAVAGTAEIIIMTHEAREADVDQFMIAAQQHDGVLDVGIRIRMESPAL